MRHDWIFDLLSDLHAYAIRNELPRLALKVEEAFGEARREVAEDAPDGVDPRFALSACRQAH